MKKSAFTLLAFLAMTGVVCAAPVLSLVTNTPPDTGMASYTVQATGIGITTLSKFTMTDAVYQVWGNTGPVLYEPLPSEWLGDGSATGDASDSYVIFGDVRIDGADPDYVTLETNPSYSYPTVAGWGTLNNYDATGGSTGGPTWDAYLKTGAPGTTEETVSLMQLVVADTIVPADLGITLTLYTATNYDPVTGLSDVEAHPDLTLGVDPVLEGGDTDGDGDIDGTDLANFASGWVGPDGAGYDGISTTAAEWATGDFDEDVDVDGTDLATFAAGWYGENGAGYVPPVGVPEPSTIVMLILGALCLVGYRVRK